MTPDLTKEYLNDLEKRIVYWRTIRGIKLNPADNVLGADRIQFQHELTTKINNLMVEYETLNDYLEN